MTKKRVAILISGRGSNMAALIDAAQSPDFPAEIVGVISNRADAKGLAIAAAKGISTAVIPSKDITRPEHATALDAAIQNLRADIVCLAGYMRLLDEAFVARWQGKLINIHPSLLPLFKGTHPHDQALEAGVRIHGCTVHFVTPEVDSGPIIAQAAVPVQTGDDADSLSVRVLSAEHRLYGEALALLASGKVKMEGGKAVFADFIEEPATGRMISAPAPRPDIADLESLARRTP
ncbi:MAG: phosphoribosylglycinamide formyltransferase [Mesorhizobium sp.]